MKEEKKYSGGRINAAFIGGLIIGAVLVIVITNPAITTLQITGRTGETNSVDEILDKCRIGEPHERIYCVGNEIKKVYKYTEPHVGVQSIEKTFRDGGICKDYSRIWDYVAEEYHLDSQLVYFQLDEKYRHVFNVISWKGGYCMADGAIAHCIQMDV